MIIIIIVIIIRKWDLKLKRGKILLLQMLDQETSSFNDKYSFETQYFPWKWLRHLFICQTRWQIESSSTVCLRFSWRVCQCLTLCGFRVLDWSVISQMEITWKRWGTEEKKRTAFGVVGVVVEIRTKHFPSTVTKMLSFSRCFIYAFCNRRAVWAKNFLKTYKALQCPWYRKGDTKHFLKVKVKFTLQQGIQDPEGV